MTVFMFLSFVLECSDIAFDAAYLGQVTGPTFQLFFFCDRWVYMLMMAFLFTGLAKLCLTVVLSKRALDNGSDCYGPDMFEIREIHLVFSFLFEGNGIN